MYFSQKNSRLDFDNSKDEHTSIDKVVFDIQTLIVKIFEQKFFEKMFKECAEIYSVADDGLTKFYNENIKNNADDTKIDEFVNLVVDSIYRNSEIHKPGGGKYFANVCFVPLELYGFLATTTGTIKLKDCEARICKKENMLEIEYINPVNVLSISVFAFPAGLVLDDVRIYLMDPKQFVLDSSQFKLYDGRLEEWEQYHIRESIQVEINEKRIEPCFILSRHPGCIIK